VVENVTVVPEGTEDALYLVVRRTINSVSRRYVERMATRRVDDIIDSIFMDSVLSYDGRNATPSHTMTLSGGTTWGPFETLTLTSSTAFFTVGDVGNAIHLTGSDGTEIRCTITAYSSTTVVSVQPHKTVPVGMRSVAISVWARAVDVVSGLSHLEGEDVSVFADGFVVANPNNAQYVTVTVNAGTAVLDRPYAVIHVGMPYLSDMETLDVDTAQGETIVDKRKLVTKVTAFVDESRGLWVGGKPPSDDDTDPLEDLTELKIREDETTDEPVKLATGTVDVNISGEWNSNGRVFIRQVDPVPLAVLSVAPAGLFPFRG